MKKSLVFLLLCSAALLSCSDDDSEDPAPDNRRDQIRPAVTIISPANGDTISVFSGIKFLAEITDDTKIDKITVGLTQHFGSSLVLSEYKISNSEDFKRYTVDARYRIPRYTPLTENMITVEVRDWELNMANADVIFTLTAPDLNRTTFEEPFVFTFFDDVWLEALDWYGYNYYDRGFAFDEHWLSVLLNFMVNTSIEDKYGVSETEWENFLMDFNLKSQAWANWDRDRNGELNDTEFHEAVKGLNLFKAWDADRNETINEKELAAGIFSLWDHDGNNELKPEEYLEKFYTYLYSRRQ